MAIPSSVAASTLELDRSELEEQTSLRAVLMTSFSSILQELGASLLVGVDPTVESPADICADARGGSVITAVLAGVAVLPQGQFTERPQIYHILTFGFMLKAGRPPAVRSCSTQDEATELRGT